MAALIRLSCVCQHVAIMAISIAAAAVTGTTASAAPVVWGAAQNISGDSDVITSGSLVYGYQFGTGLTGTTIVNGVQFQPFNVSNGVSTATLGSVTLTSTGSNPYPGVMYSASGITSGSAPYATLSGDYQSLLSSKVASFLEDTNGGARLDIQLGGLTAGTSYLVQWWSSVTNILYEPYQTVALGSPNATLDANTTDATGGLGQYVTGTFTAAGASQTITLLGLTMNAPPYDAPTINALQVRAVPEPATYAMALAGLACGGFSMWRRRKPTRPNGRSVAIAASLAIVAACVATGSLHATPITIDWVTVGDPGNAADNTGSPNPTGAVAEAFQVMKYEVTNTQYVAFLNAVASTDTYSLYHTSMGSTVGGITRSGSSGSYAYALRANMGDKPVNYISWFDAARFANWLQNGQGSGSTETGAYTLVAGQTSGTAPARNAGATFYIPTVSQWYKAAYYKGGGTNAGYWDYATQSNTAPTTVLSGSTGIGSAGGTGNFANYNRDADWDSLNGNVTTVGSNGGPSAYGAFDMGGNVQEWNDAGGTASTNKMIRGGAWNETIATNLSSSYNNTIVASAGDGTVGFRLASPVPVPEPSTVAMVLAGMACGGYSLWRRWKRA